MTSSFLNSAKFFTLTQLISSVAIFLRNLILARLLSVDDFGVASTFVIVMSFIEAFSTIGIDKYLLVTKNRPDRQMMGTAHFLFLLRGAVVSILLYVMAGWLANIFGVPDLAWAYQMLALIPIIKGFTHFSYVLQQREGRYLALSVFELSGQLISLLVVGISSLYYADYRIALYAVMVTMIVPVLLSHFYSRECPYSVYPGKENLLKMLRFAWPIFLGSMLIFAVLHGDKTIVGVFYSLNDLAIFSIAFSLLSLPAMVLAKLYTSVYLAPMATECSSESSVERPVIAGVVLHFLVFGFLAVSGFSMLGVGVIGLVYGDRYEPSQDMIFLIALSMALRLMRTPTSLMAIASHKLTIGLKQDLIRALAIVPGFYFASMGADLNVFLWVAVAGEFSASIVGYWLIRDCLGTVTSLVKIAGMYLYFSLFVVIVYFASAWGQSIFTEIGLLLLFWLVYLASLAFFDRSFWYRSWYIFKRPE